jgi:hypothetical protein
MVWLAGRAPRAREFETDDKGCVEDGEYKRAKRDKRRDERETETETETDNQEKEEI